MFFEFRKKISLIIADGHFIMIFYELRYRSLFAMTGLNETILKTISGKTAHKKSI